jgi:hypothetical protein
MASQEEPQPIEVNGRALRCIICSHNLFWVRNALLNKATSTFFNLDWADKSATCFVCAECTYIHWFLGK